jgi:ankyrin repeat protein
METRTLVALVLHTIDRTPLHFAALNGHLHCVTHLVENGSEIDAKDVNDMTPLYLASKNGHLECVKYLVEKGANKSAKTESGYTPEGIANYNGKTEVVKFLKKNKRRHEQQQTANNN